MKKWDRFGGTGCSKWHAVLQDGQPHLVGHRRVFPSRLSEPGGSANEHLPLSYQRAISSDRLALLRQSVPMSPPA